MKENMQKLHRMLTLFALGLVLLLGGTAGWDASTAFAQNVASPASQETPAETRHVMNDVPPRPAGLRIYVNDYANLLTTEDREALQDRLQALDEAGIAQVSVLVLPDTDRDLSEFTHVIMNRWDIQHYRKRDGLLIVVNAHRVRNRLSGNRIYVGTGYALEELLPDAVIGRILDRNALPAFEQGDFSGGVTATALTIANILSGDKELHATYTQPTEGEEVSPGLFIFFLAIFILVWSLRIRRSRYYGGGFGGGPYWGGGFGGGSFGGGGGFGGGFGGGGRSSGGGGAGR
jgi:uncharacterized protein